MSINSDLRKIENDGELSLDQKVDAWKEVLETARKEMKVIDDSIEGRVDIGGKMEYLAHDYGGFRHYVPNIVGKEANAEIAYIEQAVGGTCMKWDVGNVAINPLGVPLIGVTALSLGMSYWRSREQRLSLGTAFLANMRELFTDWRVSGMCACIGLLFSFFNHISQESAEGNADYIQEKIEQVYHTNAVEQVSYGMPVLGAAPEPVQK